MHWLNVPPIQQTKPGWCLPACVAMVGAFLEQPLLQDDVARWLGARGVGTPSSRIDYLNRHGFAIFYGTGSLASIEAWLAKGTPCILFLRTGDLRYWQVDTPHAIVVAGIDVDNAAVFDPGVATSPIIVSVGNMMLAWSHFDYTYAVLRMPD